MIRAEFSVSEQKVRGFTISGHAGLAPSGSDVLCAAVSAMALLTVNTLREVFGVRFDLIERDGFLSLTLSDVPKDSRKSADGVLRGLMLQLQDLCLQYPERISVHIIDKEG